MSEREKTAEMEPRFAVGDRVEKFTGDYHLAGEVRAVFTKKDGNIRYVVERDPGFLHIYNESQLRALPTQGD